MAQNGETSQKSEPKVQQLDYEGFLKNVWDFEKNPNEFIYKGKLPAVVDFYADWCGPCRKVAPIMEELAEEFEEEIVVYKVNVDQARQLSGLFQVTSIPTVLFIPMKGQPMKRVGAMSYEAYATIIDEQLLDE